MNSTDTDGSSSPSKLCHKATCAKPLIRRKGESQTHFARRLHCDVGCSSTNPDAHVKQSNFYTRQREANRRTCEREKCNKSFVRRKGQGKKNFEVQRFCSSWCHFEHQKAENIKKALSETKICKNPECGKEFHRRIGPKSIESSARFQKRDTCSNECSAAVRWSDYIPKGRVRKKKEVKDRVEDHVLPPANDLPIDIPPPPKPTTITVWRPESWGGPYTRQVS